MEKPILFSTEMIKAILDGRKTQTRRVMKPQPVEENDYFFYGDDVFLTESDMQSHLFHNVYGDKGSPYGSVYSNGDYDTLWVRETHHIDWYPEGVLDCHGKPGTVHYKANGNIISQSWAGQWRPSIFMPRWASRITLNILDVRVERLQDITNMDAVQEGVEATGIYKAENARSQFKKLWDKINAKRGYSWQSNPWVWVVEFKLGNNSQ